jgi:hypothetical protein
MRLLRNRTLPALAVVAGTLVLGGGAARADTPAFVQIGPPGTTVIRQASANVIGIAANDAPDAAWRLSNSPATTGGVLDLGRTLPYQSGGALVDWAFTDPAYGGDPSDGMHTVYVQWQDGSGIWSPVASASVLVDTAPPDATASTDVGSAWTASTSVHVTTAATDALTGTTLVRLSNVDWTDVDGELQPGTSFPSGVEMPIPWSFSPAGEVYVQWQDGAGNWSPPITLRVHWDSSPPQVTGLRVNLQVNRQIVGGSIPLESTWSPSSTAPLAQTVVERLAGAGTYAPIYRGSARTRFLRVAPERRYRLRVRASDIAGLRSGWAVRPAFMARLVDDRDPRILWSPGWKRVPDPTAVGGSMRCASRYGRWADLQVRWGSDLGFVSPEGPRYGTAAIAVRGSRTPTATVTLTRPTPRPRTLAYRFAYSLRPVGYPEIQVRDASKNGAPVCIDAFTVLR